MVLQKCDDSKMTILVRLQLSGWEFCYAAVSGTSIGVRDVLHSGIEIRSSHPGIDSHWLR